MRFTTTVVALALSVLAAVLTAPAAADTRKPDAPASAGWHGRGIKDPQPRPDSLRASWPKGWSAGPVELGTGYHRPGGSRRVREVQRRLRKLGYRPGPVDGLFGPRTQAAAKWFQYKHGLPTTGRVNRVTLTVLTARSEHEPLGRTPAPSESDATPGTELPPALPAPSPAPVADDGPSLVPVILLIAAALVAGLLVGMLLPRRRTPTPVLGYIAGGGAGAVNAEAPALESACRRREWTLIRIVQEHEDAGARLADRPALLHALKQIEAGAASGLVVTRLQDFTTQFADLAPLMQWLTTANGFLAAVDDELDTSTPDGRATVDAVIDIASWRRQPFSGQHPRSQPDLEPRLAALHDRELPDAAIADALNLAGVPAPDGSGGWRPGDVAAASRRAEEARG